MLFTNSNRQYHNCETRKGRGNYISILNHHHHHHHHHHHLSLSLSLSACTTINGSFNDIKFISDIYNVVLYCMHIFTCTCICRVIIKIKFNRHDCVNRTFPKRHIFSLNYDQRAGISRVYIFNLYYARKRKLSIIRILL